MLARILLGCLLASVATGSPLFAQDPGQPATRAEVLARERETKAAALRPPEQGRLERALIGLENDRLLERILNPAQGVYPKLGNLTPGSGTAFGPAYRRPGVFGGHADFSTFAAGTFDRYWMLDARLTMPGLAGGRVSAELLAQRYDFPNEDFFGIGPDSRRDDEVTYGLRSTVLGAGARLRLFDWLSLAGRAEHLTPRVSGSNDDVSIERRFDAGAAPGLAQQPAFAHFEVTAELNDREPEGNPRRGGRYAVSYQRFHDRELGRYAFDRVEVDVQQYVSFLNARRVIALRGFMSSSDPDAGNEVPFYLQRTLGGPDDLRGFRAFRFRDEHVLLLQAEYRWEIFTAVDGAVFYDAGTVAPRRQELSLRELESDYGIGFRFGTIDGVFLRVEGAFGSSGGKHFILRYGHIF